MGDVLCTAGAERERDKLMPSMKIILRRKNHMKTTPEHNERMAKMTFASVYPHYVTKIENKGRTVEELHQVIRWLTDFDEKEMKNLIDEEVTFEEFF